MPAKSPVKKAPAKKEPAKKTAEAKPSHPTYQVMIQETIKWLKDRKGASRQAMKKHMMSEYKLTQISAFNFNAALKKLTEAGTLEQSETGQRWKIKKVEAAKKAPTGTKPVKKDTAASPKKKVIKPSSPAKTMATKVAAKKAAKKSPVKKVTKKAPAKKSK